jgi:CAAX prenyl protease-like protein/response regulator receiver domain-containing protein
MPVMDGLQATRAIAGAGDGAPRVLVLTTFDLDDYVYEALRAGASGFLLKDASAGELAEAVRVVASGDALLAPGVTRRLIAEFARLGAPRGATRKNIEDLTERETEVLALTPATRPLLGDQRVAGLDGRQLAYQVLVRIPVGTVGWEEIAFRGVFQASLRRVLPEPWAGVAGASVFGLWHIRPTAGALAVNGLATGRRARILAVTGVVAGTAGAGALLSVLRERSGSLVAPVLLHLAANCTGALAATLAGRNSGRGSGRS